MGPLKLEEMQGKGLLDCRGSVHPAVSQARTALGAIDKGDGSDSCQSRSRAGKQSGKKAQHQLFRFWISASLPE